MTGVHHLAHGRSVPTNRQSTFTFYTHTHTYTHNKQTKTQTVELKPNGSGIPVTRANVREYVDCYVVRSSAVYLPS